MTSPSSSQRRFAPSRSLRALALGLSLCFAAPAFADIGEVQRLLRQGQFPQAMEKVDAYLSSKPKDAQGRFLKGLIFTEMNKPNDAISVFTKLTEDYPELPEPYNNLAVLYAQQKQYDKARTALEMAIRTHPSYAIAYENLGDVYAKLASQAYDKALQLDSANAATQNKLALIRDLISASSKQNSKPQPAPAAPAAVAAKSTPAPAPSATVVATTPAASTPPTPAAKPAPVAATSPDQDEVLKAMNAWASAWSNKDMKAYLGLYAAEFAPPKGASRKDWEAERTQRITGKGGKISVTFDEPQIALNGDKATVKFRQHYKAPGLTTSTSKVLVFVRSNGRWLIQEEISR